MKRIICLILCLIIANALLAQDTSIVEKTYLKVLKHGFSTAPDFIVVTIKNLNTGESKEICTTTSFFLDGLMTGRSFKSDNSLNQYLFSKMHDRTFEFKDTVALKDLDFYNYTLKYENEIDSIIKNNHLRDSLKKTNELRRSAWNEYHKYEHMRRTLLLNFADSITKTRLLTSEQNQILSDLKETYYEDDYNNTKSFDYKKLSENGQKFMIAWNTKVKKYKEKYLQLSKEAGRLYYKFFQKYYDRYDMNFCHVAFKNGIITYIGDEVEVVGYGDVVD